MLGLCESEEEARDAALQVDHCLVSLSDSHSDGDEEREKHTMGGSLRQGERSCARKICGHDELWLV